MQRCFPCDGELIDIVLDQLLNHHEEYHKTLISSYGNVSDYDDNGDYIYGYKEAANAEDRKLGYTLFVTLNVSETILDNL